MIDYSVYLQSNPMDETAAPKAYAKAQMRESVSFDDFVNHIAEHNGVFSRGTVKGVISDACNCVVEHLLDGKKVQLGELGNFWISLSSVGTPTVEEFTSKNIKAVNIIFTPGDDFVNIVDRARFHVVASRVAQAATLKAEKVGGTVVDLEAARLAAKQGSSSSGSGSSSGAGSGSSGSGSGAGTSPSSGTSGISSDPSSVATPAISGTTPFAESTSVTISCATSGAVVHYTLDGSTPTAESATYTEAIVLTDTTTVKAIAVNGSNVSAVASRTFTKGNAGDVSDTD